MEWITITYATIFRLFPLSLILLLPFKKYLRISFWKAFPILLVVSAIVMIPTIYVFFPTDQQNNYKLYYSLTWFAVFTIILICLFRFHPFKTIFVAFIVKGYTDDVFFMSVMISKYCNFIDSERISYLLIGSFLYIATIVPVYFFVLRNLKPFFEAGDQMRFWRYLWIMPVSFYIIFRIEIYPDYLISGDPFHNNRLIILSFVWFIGTFLSYVVTLQMIGEFLRNVTLQDKLHMQEMQLSVQKNRYDNIRKDMESTWRVKHDLNHHFMAIKAYLSQHNYEELDEYLNRYIQDFAKDERQGETPVCENFAVDSIIRHYFNLAIKAGVSVTASANLTKNLPVAEGDVCVVIGNLLQNAVEGCVRQQEGKKFIDVKIEIVGSGMIALSVKNSFGGHIRKEGEHFMSSKRDARGIGIASVRSIAEQYGGVTKFEYDDNIFHAAVLLQV